jgi:hypothetical protein
MGAVIHASISVFAATFKGRRLELSLTQEDLAGRIELDRPYITLIDAGSKLDQCAMASGNGFDLTMSKFCSGWSITDYSAHRAWSAVLPQMTGAHSGRTAVAEAGSRHRGQCNDDQLRSTLNCLFG